MAVPGPAERPDGGWRPASGATAPLVLPLGEVGRDDLALVGGKAAGLGELIRAGFPVPGGFVVTTAAYDRLVAGASPGPTVSRLLDERPGDGAAIREALARVPMPPELERGILAAYRRLGQGAVAVRSSATAEDLPGAAFAGQQDTFLNLVGAEAVLSAVRRCFASLWTDRAVAYRERQGVDPQRVKLAVVVQRLVEARMAGVLFTANPVTGAREEVVIEAVPGLGEALVSGLVTPDRLVLRKRRWGRWEVVERAPGRWEVMVRPCEGGGTERVPLDALGGGRSRLSDREARRLARLGTAIQRRFGPPQDVEWARADGRTFVVQARPMTALPEPPPRAGTVGRAIASLVAEVVPVRPYPLDATSWFPALLTEALAFVSGLVGVRLPTVEELFVVEDGVVIRFRGRVPLRPTPALPLVPIRLLLAGRRRVRSEDWRRDPDLLRARARVRALERRDPSTLSWAELLATAREALALLRPLAREPRLRHLPAGVSGLLRLRLLLALAGGGRRFGDLLSGVETMTAETNRRLEALATRVRSDPELAAVFSTHGTSELWSALERRPSGRAFLSQLRSFLDEYGHREAAVSLVSMPTWKDAPEAVLGVLQGLAIGAPAPADGPRPWELARDELLGRPPLRWAPLRSAFLASLDRARWLLQVREDTHFFATMPMPALRRTFLELGRRLVAAGALDAPEEVFHLTLADLERVAEEWPPAPLVAHLRSLVRRRRERRAALEGTPLVDPRLFRRAEDGADVLLRGTPGSPGLADGPVRVVRDPSQWGQLRDGEVLVAPYTNPSWTPLFRRAAAVVADTGSAGSHAAIVAREYGIPAVMATVEGTRRLVDGERVRVDGTRGLVLQAATAPILGAAVARR